MTANDIECPRCGAGIGNPCHRSYPAQALTGALNPVEAIPGYCQARHAAARGRNLPPLPPMTPTTSTQPL